MIKNPPQTDEHGLQAFQARSFPHQQTVWKQIENKYQRNKRMAPNEIGKLSMSYNLTFWSLTVYES